MMKTKCLVIYLVLSMIPNSYSSEWVNICKIVEGLHRLDKLDKLKLDDGDLIIRMVNISLDKEDKKFTSITYSQIGDEAHIIINTDGTPRTINLDAVILEIPEKVNKLAQVEIDKHPKKEHALRAFGGISSSLLVATSQSQHFFLRLGDFNIAFNEDEIIFDISQLIIKHIEADPHANGVQ